MKTVLISIGIQDFTAKTEAKHTLKGFNALEQNANYILGNDEDGFRYKIGTNEPEQFKLDGSCYAVPDNLTYFDVGVWSNKASNNIGEFTEILEHIIDFATPHSSVGITIYFDSVNEVYATDFTIKWIDKSNKVISEKDVKNDKAICFVDNPVKEYKRLEIIYRKINKPKYYLKIFEIDYGLEKVYTERELKSSEMKKSCLNYALSLPTDTLDFEVFDDNKEFDIVNPQGVYQWILKGQKVTVYIKDKDAKNGINKQKIGTFFLDTVSSANHVITYHCVNTIGILQQMKLSRKWYQAIPTIGNPDPPFVYPKVNDLLDDIFKTLPVKYICKIDKVIEGCFTEQNRKSALEQLLLAISAHCFCDEDGNILITDTREYKGGTFSLSDQLGEVVISKDKSVNNLEITTHTFTTSLPPDGGILSTTPIYDASYYSEIKSNPNNPEDYDFSCYISLNNNLIGYTLPQVTLLNDDIGQNPATQVRIFGEESLDYMIVKLKFLAVRGEKAVGFTLKVYGLPLLDSPSKYTFKNPYIDNGLVENNTDITLDVKLLEKYREYEQVERIKNNVFDLNKNRIEFNLTVQNNYNLISEKMQDLYRVEYAKNAYKTCCISEITVNFLTGLSEIKTDNYY